jgi:predicted lipoprotein with Yx(FWY)xxD motif
MISASVLLMAGLLALAGCGDKDESGGSTNDSATTTTADAAPGAAKGTTITVGDSDFGTMLFGLGNQAIYIFENDPKGETVCYDECAEAWPPVFTDGKPEAADGVKASLLGTVKRRDDRLQVTYAGKPLYFYAHEGPGEVRCHNVNLNGGFWWVIGPDGRRRA